ncbi:MAG: VOC family protein [Paracoccus sp. (in: a-proteobacteria)]|nr:VOC family protein [Paracoccus sp. (in: a-proteobacteria)]
MKQHGLPHWFELATSQPEQSGAFYQRVFGWQTAPSGVMEGYHLARDGDAMVAGLMVPDEGQDIPPSWTVYFGVDDCAATADAATKAGATLLMGPQEVKGTGSFAVIADPQGAVFGILEPEPMDPPADPADAAWNQQKTRRGNWLDLMTPDPAAAFEFYAALFGWTRGEAMDMGEMGTYQMIDHDGRSIGAIMGMVGAPVPSWVPYFGAPGPVTALTETITEAGGKIIAGPREVPGPVWIAQAQDPQGALFAIVGTEK